AETEGLPPGPIRLLPRGGSACVILQKLAGRVRYFGVVECCEIRWEFHPPVSGLDPLKFVDSIPELVKPDDAEKPTTDGYQEAAGGMALQAHRRVSINRESGAIPQPPGYSP